MLARGGMAEVFLARMSGVGGFAKLLVIKRILPHLGDDPEFREMFMNEGRVAARLNHPNICQVFELDEVVPEGRSESGPLHSRGEVFLAMEYLDGLAWGDLVPLVPRGRGVELRVAATVIGQICEGLRFAHEHCDVDGTPMPIVHRDVSPQNLFITTEGVCKLLDFGVSKVLTEGSRTRTGMLKGKLPYMAPEQIRGEAVDARADVFSMGVVLWEALVGERLFNRESDYQIWKAITEEEIPRVTSRVSGLPPQIDAVIERALERDVQRRYPTIRTFAAELRDVAARAGGTFDQPTLSQILRSLGAGKLAETSERVSRAIGRPSRLGDPPPLPAEITMPGPSAEPSVTDEIALRDAPVKLRRKSRGVRTAIVVGAVAIAAGVVAAIWSRDDAATPAATASTDASVIVAEATPDAAAAEIEPDALEHIEVADPAMPTEKRVVRRPKRKAEAPRVTVDAGVAADPGFYSVDSRPYATIYIDDKSYGETPLFKVQLPAGKHRIRAVRADGKSQRLTITITPGKVFSSGRLRW